MSAELPANAAADAANTSDFADAADAARPPNGVATTPPPRGALILLCGLPAAGKSTLAARLLSDGPSALRAALGGGDVRVWHLCFDRLLLDLQTARNVERFDPELWHEARARALGAVHEFFGRATGESAAGTDAAAADGDSPPPLELLAPSERTNGGAAPPFEVVVVDDNLQYRSMRKPYHRVARAAGLAICTVCVRVDLEVALARNRARGPAERVPEATVRQMAEALQWPSSDQPWEGRALWPAADAPPPWAELADALRERAPPPFEEGERAREAAAAASAAETAASAAHQLDLRLRRTMAARMAAAAALPPAERAALAQLLTAEKKRALALARARLGGGERLDSAATAEEAVEAAVDELEAAFALVRLVSVAAAAHDG